MQKLVQRVTVKLGQWYSLTLLLSRSTVFPFLRKRRCYRCGTRRSVTPTVWACGWLHIFAQCTQQTANMRVCIYLRVCMYGTVDANWQRPAIVPPMVYLHLTQAGAWCEMWSICTMLRPVLCRQRFLLTSPQHWIISWPLALPTAPWLYYQCDLNYPSHHLISYLLSSASYC